MLAWAGARGVGFDPRYPKAQDLTPLSGLAHSRFWLQPCPAAALPHFFGTCFQLVVLETECHVWRGGRWGLSDAGPSPGPAAAAHDRLLQVLGIPAEHRGGVQLERREFPELLLLLISASAFGWTSVADLYVVPDTGRYVLHTDHHDVIWVRFAQADDVAPFVAAMEAAGYPLPTGVPDDTFKVPEWMNSGAAGA
jgi:hypothetical protein